MTGCKTAFMIPVSFLTESNVNEITPNMFNCEC